MIGSGEQEKANNVPTLFTETCKTFKSSLARWRRQDRQRAQRFSGSKNGG